MAERICEFCGKPELARCVGGEVPTGRDRKEWAPCPRLQEEADKRQPREGQNDG